MNKKLETSTTLSHYSIGMGDRFAHQADAQLQACIQARQAGCEVTPVWNKSNREHVIVGSEPTETRAAADKAVARLGWSEPYFLDADHINLKTVGRFVAPCDFFTIDVADWIGQGAPAESIDAFAGRHPELSGKIKIAGIDTPLELDSAFVIQTARKYLRAIQEAGEVYRRIEQTKGRGRFVTEVSMDETDSSQSPAELLVILAAIADEPIPIQTIAPKFSGRFNKGVDYVGNLDQFSREFAQDIATIALAVDRYDLPPNLKLSVHSGSDKFSLYPIIHSALKDSGAGIHVKTAGTTWLEELIGLAESGGQGLALAKDIYGEAHAHRQELCEPYATVIDINPADLPPPEQVKGWSADEFVGALRHDEKCGQYNSSLRQLLHVGFKVAAKMGARYTDALATNQHVIAKNVTGNLFDRHIKPIFLGS